MMGYLGFLFEHERMNSDREVGYYVLFVHTWKWKNNYVIGRKLMAPKSIDDQLLIDTDLSILPFTQHWYYLKFSMSRRTCVDHTSMLFWFAPEKYKLICQLLRIMDEENSEEIMIERLNELLSHFV